MAYPHTVLVSADGQGYRWFCGCGQGRWYETERECRDEGYKHQQEHTLAFASAQGQQEPTT